MKKIRKSFILFTILTLIMLSTVFILPSVLFADTHTFNAIPLANWNVFTFDIVQFQFDLTGIDINKINSGKLRIWTVDVEGANDNVAFNGNIVGQLQLQNVGYLSEFDVSIFSIDGINPVWVTPDVDAIQVYQSELVINTIGSVSAEPVWERDSEMKCKQVWINEDNKFQFSFIYPYADNNWVKIYDASGKEVYSIDMPYDNPNIIVNLPDGTYTVKTFHDQIEPIQEFVIGKP
jgi:hypothetical protein